MEPEVQYKQDLKWLMSDERGRRLMHGWFEEAGLLSQSFTGNSQTFYKEGKRHFAIARTNELRALHPSLYLQMLTEAQQ